MFNCAAYYLDGTIKGAKVEDIGGFHPRALSLAEPIQQGRAAS
jgi:hypothetical protein